MYILLANTFRVNEPPSIYSGSLSKQRRHWRLTDCCHLYRANSFCICWVRTRRI